MANSKTMAEFDEDRYQKFAEEREDKARQQWERATMKRLAEQAKAKTYKNPEQQKMAERFRELEVAISKGDLGKTQIAKLREEQEKIADKLARWLHVNNYENFRVFEFNGEGQPHEEPTVTGVNPGKAFGGTAKTHPVLSQWKRKYGVKQDDILIFYPTDTNKYVRVFLMLDDNKASWKSYRPEDFVFDNIFRGDLFGLDDALYLLGLTPDAALRLWSRST